MPKKNILIVPVWIKVMASANQKKTGQQISFEHRLSRPHLIDVTNELQRQGWITLNTTKHNKRDKIITTTPQGKQITKACRIITKATTTERTTP